MWIIGRVRSGYSLLLMLTENIFVDVSRNIVLAGNIIC
mgnify:CR=1 FL=1